MVSRSWAGGTGGRWMWLLKGQHEGVCDDGTAVDHDNGGGTQQHAHMIKLHIRNIHTHVSTSKIGQTEMKTDGLISVDIRLGCDIVCSFSRCYPWRKPGQG